MRQRQANFLSLAPRESHPPAPKWGQWTRHLHRQLNHKRLIKKEKEKASARTTTQSRLLRTLNRNVIHSHIRTNPFKKQPLHATPPLTSTNNQTQQYTVHKRACFQLTRISAILRLEAI